MTNVNITEEQWEKIKDYIRTEFSLTSASYKTWIAPLEIGGIIDGKLYLVLSSLQSDELVNYVTNKYKTYTQVALQEITNQEYSVVFCAKMPKAPEIKKPGPVMENDVYKQSNLNPRYTFDNFVVGNNNSMAHAASLAVAESPGEMYNPLFIHGGVGLGKTHLMHSIANFILKNNPQAKILYTTSEQFTNELIDAIRNPNSNATSNFRQKYRTIDVLLIDDIQFLAKKESTQQEFFHTFNDLYESKKQLVISSDRPPKELNALEERLQSRFQMGLTVDISSPDYETRMAILRKKEETEGYNIDNEVLKYIANNVKSNIRELEGSLNKIIAYSKLYNTEITMKMAEVALKDIINETDERVVTPELITQIVADHYSISVTDLLSTKRNREISYPRQITMYLCHVLTSVPLNMIGQALGGRDHTTILHGIHRIEGDIKTDINLKKAIDTLTKKINPPAKT